MQVQEERGVLGCGGEREPAGEQQRHRGALRSHGGPEDAHVPLGHARVQAGPQRQGAPSLNTITIAAFGRNHSCVHRPSHIRVQPALSAALLHLSR